MLQLHLNEKFNELNVIKYEINIHEQHLSLCLVYFVVQFLN